jgi:hypothetical protein
MRQQDGGDRLLMIRLTRDDGPKKITMMAYGIAE